MAEGTHPRGRGSGGAAVKWARGLALFAGIMMVMTGTFGAIQGLAAILNDDVYVLRGDYVFKFDVTAWGWIHMVIGILVAVAGFYVLYGRLWARVIGIACAVVSGIVNFAFIPYYPVWSLTIVALDAAVIWALAVYSRQAAESGWRE
ncbi:DUF7144 family membrane protein [Actinomadura gamaensis]|uniref:DUF7144 domain-containing protein n=1 Tax=Actinomadura gamaensis TaxID=1763541 RepID=A0ABV9U148_9ACTN